MTKAEQVQLMTEKISKLVAIVGKKLPDDVEVKLAELCVQETKPLAQAIYATMAENQKLAEDLNRPCCQDTGVLQFGVSVYIGFPLQSLLLDRHSRSKKQNSVTLATLFPFKTCKA